MTNFSVTRYHDISCGHRVVGHESKCRHMHGHNYRIHFTCASSRLDNIGRVIDFSVVKERLCMWVEENWDHKFLAWEQDPLMQDVFSQLGSDREGFPSGILGESIVFVPFNPTAENMAQYLVEIVGPTVLPKNIVLIKVCIEETSKCSAEYSLNKIG